MAIYDRWHLSHPQNHPDWERLQPCRCGRGRNRLYPTADHGVPKRWQVRYRDDEGKQRKRNFAERNGDDPERHAEAFDHQVGHELDADEWIDPDLGKVSLAEYAKQWRAGLTADPSSLETIDKRLAHIYDVPAGPRSRRAPGRSVIGEQQMRALSRRPSLIQQWVKGLERKQLSAIYIRQIVDTLSSIFIAAIDDGLVKRNPVRAKSLTLPTVDKRVIVPWTAPMVAAARTVMEDRKGIGAMVDLGAGAGLRQGEIFGIAEDDIVFLGKRQDRKIRIRRQVKLVAGKPVFALPKGGKEREAPLPDALSQALAAHIKAHPPAEVELPWKTPDSDETVKARLLFVRPDGRPWHGRLLEYTWGKARESASAAADGAEAGGMHDLRHTFASICLHEGVDVVKLARWLGHADPGFTLRIYGHFIPDVTDRGGAAVDSFLSPPEDGQSALDVPSGDRG